MTDQESIHRAERIITLFIDSSDPRHSLLVTEVARELRIVDADAKIRVEKYIAEPEPDTRVTLGLIDDKVIKVGEVPNA